MRKVILDVDTGVDDALAILYGLESGQLDFLGITTVNGNVPLEMVNRNTLKVLQLAGREDLKVYSGAESPLMREAEHEFKVHGSDGIGNALDDVTLEMELEHQFAADFIIESAREHRKELTLVMVGPLTNLALALKKEPRLAGWIGEVIIMGGLVSLAGRGNTLPTSEFNIYADAEAARIVFHSGAEVTLVSMDVTLQTFLTIDHIEAMKGKKYYNFIKRSTDVFRSFSMQRYNVNGCALHDPLTVGFAMNREFLKTKKYYVDVETISPLSYGQTICDFRNLWKKEPNVNVCLDVDAEGFVKHFVETISVS